MLEAKLTIMIRYNDRPVEQSSQSLRIDDTDLSLDEFKFHVQDSFGMNIIGMIDRLFKKIKDAAAVKTTHPLLVGANDPTQAIPAAGGSVRESEMPESGTTTNS